MNNISENEVDKNLDLEATLQDDKDQNFDADLINIVKSYPHLYDSSRKDYHDMTKKENTWIEISEILGMSSDKCCIRWTRLRESFSKERKRRQNETNSGSEASTRRGFVYFESMKFIDKFVKTRTRNSMSNIKFQQKYADECSTNEEISNSVQRGKRYSKRERTSVEQSEMQTENTSSPIKKYSKRETSSITNNLDDTSCASSSTSENNTNDFIDESSSACLSPVMNNSLPLSPISVKSTDEAAFKKPSYTKEKFNSNIPLKKGGINKKSEKNLNSKKHDNQMQNDSDTLFCNLIVAELNKLDDCEKQIKKLKIMHILWQKEKSE